VIGLHPPIEPYAHGLLTGGRAARRPRPGLPARNAADVRPGPVPRRAARPARLRPEPAARGWLVGHDARAGVRRGLPAPGDRDRGQRDQHHAPIGDRLAVPRRRPHLPRGVATLPRGCRGRRRRRRLRPAAGGPGPAGPRRPRVDRRTTRWPRRGRAPNCSSKTGPGTGRATSNAPGSSPRWTRVSPQRRTTFLGRFADRPASPGRMAASTHRRRDGWPTGPAALTPARTGPRPAGGDRAPTPPRPAAPRRR
jgi:hypothetical protein